MKAYFANATECFCLALIEVVTPQRGFDRLSHLAGVLGKLELWTGSATLREFLVNSNFGQTQPPCGSSW